MSSYKSELQVITKAKDLCRYVMQVTHKSPKEYRFTYVVRMQNLAFMHNLTSLYDAHAEYYLKDASVKEEDREFLFMLVKGTKYISFSTEKIHQALFGNGVECFVCRRKCFARGGTGKEG